MPLGALHLLGNAHLRNGDLRRARECFLACVRLGYDADWQMLVQIELDASAAAREATHRQARQGQEAVATLNKHLAQHAQAEVQAQAQGLGIGLGGPPAPQQLQRRKEQSQSKQRGRDAASTDTATAASDALDRAEAEAAIAAGATATQSQSGPVQAENDAGVCELSGDDDEGGADGHDAAALDSSFAAQVRVAGTSFAPLFEPVRPVSPGSGSYSATAPSARGFDAAPIVSAATGGVLKR